MAEDDFHVIVYKILLYLYGVLKRKFAFDMMEFDALISKRDISDGYLTDILRMMQEDKLIRGANFKKVCGNEHILTSDMSDISITSAGIEYLKENPMMQKVGSALKESAGIVHSLAKVVKL